MIGIPVIGFILAGGQGRRLGGVDKAFIGLAGRPLISHVIAGISGQVEDVVINANGDPTRFAMFACPVVADDPLWHGGPFAGLATARALLAARADAEALLLTVPTDTPFLPGDLVDRLATALTEAGATAAYAASRGRPHPVVALWSRGSLEALVSLMVQSDVRRLQTLLPVIGGVEVGFPADPIDPFFNINTHDDLATAEAARVRAGSPK